MSGKDKARRVAAMRAQIDSALASMCESDVETIADIASRLARSASFFCMSDGRRVLVGCDEAYAVELFDAFPAYREHVLRTVDALDEARQGQPLDD